MGEDLTLESPRAEDNQLYEVEAAMEGAKAWRDVQLRKPAPPIPPLPYCHNKFILLTYYIYTVTHLKTLLEVSATSN